MLRTLTSLSHRVGQKKVAVYVLPLIEMLLEDPEDLVILENIKMVNQLVKLRLIEQKSCIRIFGQL